MKVQFWSAILCSCLFLGVSGARAQDNPPQGVIQDLAPDVSADAADPQAQPPSQTAPQNPAQNPPQTAPGTPAIPKPTVQLPPAPPQQTQPATIIAEHDTEGDYLSLEPMFWLTKTAPVMSPANGNTFTNPGSLHFPGHSKYGEGAAITVPTTRENSIQFTYFRLTGQNNSYLPAEVYFFGNGFSAGDLLYSAYTVQTMKLSWNYLSWPYPSKGAKLRIKSLWEMQYAQISTTFNAPADTTAIETYGTKRVIYPTFGIGAEYHMSKRFYLNVKVSAFGFPHHADIVDGEGDLVMRMRHVEAMLGDRYYHFKTSPRASDEYFFFTMTGPFFGVRYVWR
ncbi:MAG TPA: hypothetical protein VK419_09365 [Bryobacteraceae bacterium]|nr:hypothetical protein [Bryobacteraceae bacterium]